LAIVRPVRQLVEATKTRAPKRCAAFLRGGEHNVPESDLPLPTTLKELRSTDADRTIPRIRTIPRAGIGNSRRPPGPQQVLLNRGHATANEFFQNREDYVDEPGDILLLYSDGVYDGGDEADRLRLESIVRNLKNRGAKEICTAILEFAVEQDRLIQQAGEPDRIDDKTAFVIKHF